MQSSSSLRHHLVPIKPPQQRSPAGPPSCPPNTVRTRSAQKQPVLKHNPLGSLQKVLLLPAAPEVRTSSHLLLKHSEGPVISGTHAHSLGVRACVTEFLLTHKSSIFTQASNLEIR